jgi:hypothetical protein
MNDVLVGIIPLIEAKAMQDKMQQKGAELILNHNEQTCTRGCTVTVEVRCEEQHLPLLKQVMTENYQAMIEGLDVDFEQISSVFDQNQSEATCPACGTHFATTHTECPECGLVFF